MSAERRRPFAAEHLLQSELKAPPGCDRTGWSWKGRPLSARQSFWEAKPVMKLTASFLLLQSSLLSSVLGELPAEKGSLRVEGQLTYASQQPWVYPGTIRSNILFGKTMNTQKYERVIKACALKRV